MQPITENLLAEVHLYLAEATLEPVCSLLLDALGSGIEIRDSETSGLSDIAPETGVTSADTALADTAEIVIWVPESDVAGHVARVETFLSALRDLGDDVPALRWTQRMCDITNWVDAYREHFTTQRIGQRFILKPSWEAYQTQPRDLVIEIDPGMAFGTGLHESTQLVLRALERVAAHHVDQPPQRIIDIGCGTGVLAIAAARLWPKAEILAIDNDPSAIAVCRENMEKNNIAESENHQLDRCSAAEMIATRPRRIFDLVLANLSFEVMASISPDIPALVAPNGGCLIASGLLKAQAKTLATLYCSDLSMSPLYSEEDGEWRALILRRAPVIA